MVERTFTFYVVSTEGVRPSSLRVCFLPVLLASSVQVLEEVSSLLSLFRGVSIFKKTTKEN